MSESTDRVRTMTDDNWKTLRVPPEDFEHAREQKERHGRTWGEQLVCEDPTVTEVVDADALADELAREVARQLDHAQLANAVADEVEARLR
jgi:hypothetical protein